MHLFKHSYTLALTLQRYLHITCMTFATSKVPFSGCLNGSNTTGCLNGSNTSCLPIGWDETHCSQQSHCFKHGGQVSGINSTWQYGQCLLMVKNLLQAKLKKHISTMQACHIYTMQAEGSQGLPCTHTHRVPQVCRWGCMYNCKLPMPFCLLVLHLQSHPVRGHIKLLTIYVVLSCLIFTLGGKKHIKLDNVSAALSPCFH